MTVTAGRDDDAADDVAHVTHAVRGPAGRVLSGPRVRVAVNDDDVRGLTLATTTLAGGVTEGSSATYAVRLDTEPDGSGDGGDLRRRRRGVGGRGFATVARRSEHAAVPRDELGYVANGDGAGAARTTMARTGAATLTHDPSGADYGRGGGCADVTFAVTDDDAKGATPSATDADGAGERLAASYALVLDTEPVGRRRCGWRCRVRPRPR